MKKVALFFALAITVIACKSDDDGITQILGCTDLDSINYNAVATTDDGSCIYPVQVNFTFSHDFNGETITNSDFDIIQYTNEHGEMLSVSKLVYLISDITFTSSDGTVYDAGDYNQVNVREARNLTFTPNIEIPPGSYTVSFTFGFDDEDNLDGAYPDLNVANWNVPAMLGGGYHYMRLEGKYINTMSEEINYQYHTIRAADMTAIPLLLQDTSFEVDLGQITIGDNTNIEIEMDVAEWFKNPNLWDLNVLYTVLMPNFNAQVSMSENGQSVFSLGTVTQ